MNKLIRNGVLFLLFCITLSCEKEVFITDSLRIADELKSVVEKHKLEHCNIYLVVNGSEEIKHAGTNFEISNGFIIVNEQLGINLFLESRYNLMYLSKYEIRYSENGIFLNLFFSNIY